MLRIRPEQMKVLSDNMLRQFEERVYMHLLKWRHKQCTEVGEETVRASIQEGIERAANYGITRKRNVIIFLDVMYVLCPSFDTDPRFPWAREILNDSSLPPSRKTRQLWDKTKQIIKSQREQTS